MTDDRVTDNGPDMIDVVTITKAQNAPYIGIHQLDEGIVDTQII